MGSSISTAPRPTLCAVHFEWPRARIQDWLPAWKGPVTTGWVQLQCPEPSIVSEYLSNELKLNQVIKLTKIEAKQMKIHSSPFGLIPKKNKPGKWRLIVDLSAPDRSSVNDGIERDMISLSYTSVDTIVARVIQLGQGTLLSKMDIKQAYRLVPIHPEDRYLLGMEWQGVGFGQVLAFWAKISPPTIFSSCRCFVMDDAVQGSIICGSLCR